MFNVCTLGKFIVQNIIADTSALEFSCLLLGMDFLNLENDAIFNVLT